MYRIVICEDERMMAEHIEGLAQSILDAEGVSHRIDVVYDGRELLRLLAQPGYECHVILLDIMMGDLSGMDAARRLREQGHPATIVFITISQGYAVEGYDVQAMSYLLKPVDKLKLKRVLTKDYRENFLHRYLILPQRSQTHSLQVRDISYLEIDHRRIAVHMPDRVIHHTAKLDELEAQLPDGLFVRCHKSYLANLDRAKMVKRYRLVMVTGEEVPISKAFYDDVKRRFLARLES